MDQPDPDVKARSARSAIAIEPPEPPPEVDLDPACDTLGPRSIRMFSKGQKVVCINDDFPPEAAVLFAELPKKDSV